MAAADHTADHVKRALDSALDSVMERDLHLLQTDTSERSLTHQLAVYLAASFPELHVDCEYNRDGFDVKRLALDERDADDDDVDAITVFPDVVVHERGGSDRNLLVIEVKKASSTRRDDYDLKKLDAFKRDLGYRYAVHVRIGFDRKGALVRKLDWR